MPANRTTDTKVRLNRWATALESGKYDQVQGILANTQGFCCLGVACKIEYGEVPLNNALGYDSLQARLSLSQDEQQVLVRWNDDDNKTFPEIAALIRQAVERDITFRELATAQYAKAFSDTGSVAVEELNGC